jgi:hypothetical protein
MSDTGAELGGIPCSLEMCARGCHISPRVVVSSVQQACRDPNHAAPSSASPGRLPLAERPRCGAMTRMGRPCQAPASWDGATDTPRNGRCRLHGGLSTGPRTSEGRERIAAAQRNRWQQMKATESPQAPKLPARLDTEAGDDKQA